MFSNPDTQQIRQMLRQIKSIAVVGLSTKEGRPSNRVARGMQQRGYRIVPVRPAVDTVLGEKAYPNLAALPEPVDIVDVFRASEYVGEIVDECIRLGVKRLWLQDGVVDEAAAERAVAAGIEVVMDRCIWRDCLALCT